MYYLIQTTTQGDKIVFQGERQVLLDVARQLRERMPHIAVRVSDLPVDPNGNNLLTPKNAS